MCKYHNHFLGTNAESATMEWEQGHSRTISYSKITLLDSMRHAFLSTSLALQSKFAELWDVELFLLELGSCPGSNLLDFHSGLVITLLHLISATRRLCWLCKPAQPGAQKVGEKRWDKRQQTSESYLSILQDLSSLSWWLVRVGWESQHWLTGDKQKTTLVMNLTVFLIFNLVMRLIKLRAG